jgi:hypothetical protein
MAIVTTNDYIKYNISRHEYVLQDKAVINELPYSDADLNRRVKEWKGWLPKWSKNVMNFIYSTNQPSMRKYVQHQIYKNLHNEVDILIDAMIEYVFEVMESEVDLENEMPMSVKKILSNGNLLYQGTYCYEIEESYGVDF